MHTGTSIFNSVLVGDSSPGVAVDAKKHDVAGQFIRGK